MASFRKRGKHWEARIRYQDPATGKYKEKTLSGFRTKKEAEIAAAELESQLKKGIMPPEMFSRQLTFEDVFEEWWRIHASTIKKTTQRTLKSQFKKIFQKTRKTPIEKFTKAFCQQIINELAEELDSVKNYKTAISQVFDYAVRMGYVAENPMDAVILPKKPKDFLAEERPEENFWTKDEVRAFLKIAKEEMNPQDYVMFYLLIYTGMRKSELLALEWKDVDLEEATITVSKTVYFEGREPVFQKTKTYESRTLHLDPQTVALLKKWRVQQREYLLQFGYTHPPRFVIMRPDGRPERVGRPNYILDQFVKRHGFRRITAHGLRHTHASLLFEAGASLKEVQDRLGHRNVETTMSIYTHVTKTVRGKTVERFAQYMEE